MRQRSNFPIRLCLHAGVLILLFTGVAVQPAGTAPRDAEPAAEFKLERVPPLSLEETMRCTEVVADYRIDLVAIEPQVVDPVAMAFDEAGRLYVVEMRDYSEKDQERLGRVRLLTDEDGDGVYETSSVFAEDLSWPTAVICYDGGVFIGDAPDILYCKDTNGDGRADARRIVYTGFGRSNVQGLLNSFQWGLDHRIYGATSVSGGTITRPGTPMKPVELRGRDFSFDPTTLDFRATTGGGQHGLTFNRWGDRFVCHNGDHLQTIVCEERYLARNPFQSGLAGLRSIASDGPQAEVYRISPVEKWREIRTHMRATGQAPGVLEGGGRASGYFTSGTGITVDEGGLGANPDDPIVYIADVGSNLIHRKRLSPDGVTYRGDRIDDRTEFVRSRDLWFRPVQMAIGPDGALYVADMNREVIEHPKAFPEVLKQQLDLTSGDDRGRIFKVVPKDYVYHRPAPLDAANSASLAAALVDANQWRRSTALRLIYERRKIDPELLREQLTATKRPEGRIALLYALDSVGLLADADLLAALGDAHPQVRRHAIRLGESRLNGSAALRKKLADMATDSEPVVVFQLALSLGECTHSEATAALARILTKHPDNADMTGAVLTSIADREGELLTLILRNDSWLNSPASEPVVSSIVRQIIRQQRGGDVEDLTHLLEQAAMNKNARRQAVLLRALGNIPERTIRQANSPQLASLADLRARAIETAVAHARQVLEQGDSPEPARVEAIAQLAFGKFEAAQEWLDRLLAPNESLAIHSAVFAACGRTESAEVAPLIVGHWPHLSPRERAEATELLLRRAAWAEALLKFLEEEKIPLASLDPSHVARLQNYPSAKVKSLARKLRVEPSSGERKKILDAYLQAVLAGGDAQRGAQVFQKNCATCHEVGGAGTAVGPSLAAMVNRGTETLLFNVLNPNAEVDPRYMEYSLVTTDGQVVSGLVAGESAAAITLRGQEGKSTTVLRVEIDDFRGTGRSLMPEGFERLIDKSSMADLIAFLKQKATGPTATPAHPPGAQP